MKRILRKQGAAAAAAAGALLFALTLVSTTSIYAHDPALHAGGGGGDDNKPAASAATAAAGGTAAAAAAAPGVPETQLELEIIDTGANDPLLGSEVPLENATVKATITQGDETVLGETAAHEEGKATGVYGLHAELKENGPHVTRWQVTPKNGEAFTVDFPLQVSGAAATAPGTTAGAGATAAAATSPLLSGWRLIAAILGGIVILSVVFVLGRASGSSSNGNGKNGNSPPAASTTITSLLLVAALLGASSGPLSAGPGHGPGEAGHGDEGAGNAATGTAAAAAAPAAADLKVGIGDTATATATKTVGRYKVTLTVKVVNPEPSDPNLIRLTEAQAKTIGIQTVPVLGGRFDTGISVTGAVQADPAREVTLSSRVAGRLRSVTANIGDRVRAGQVLATIESPEIAGAQGAYTAAQGEVLSREAAYRQTQGRVRIAERQLSQQRELARAGAFSQAPLQEARSAQAEVASELATVRADLAEARSQLAQAEADQAAHERALARIRELFEAGIRSRAELEAQELEVTQDQARVKQARALIEQQQARVKQGETRVRVAGQALSREQRLASSGVLTRREIVQAQGALDTARLEARQALADLNTARRGVQSARASLAAVGATPGSGNAVTLTASIDGVIAAREAAVGETVGPDKALFTLLNPSVVVVEGDVFEQDLARVRAGTPARITTDAVPGKMFSGRVQSVSATVDPETRAARARIVITNPAGVLRPGTFVRALLVTDPRPETITVPDAAVQSEAGLKVVYVKKGDAFERREVAVGETAGGRAEIKSGVQPGEPVVTTGAYQLRAMSQRR